MAYIFQIPTQKPGKYDKPLVKELGQNDKIKLGVKLLDFGVNLFLVLHVLIWKAKVPKLLILKNRIAI